MKIVFFAHPDFFETRSMPRFARMLLEGMRGLGHEVELWAPQAQFYSMAVPGTLRKWLGYIDQYLLFPASVRKRLKACTPDTLFVFTDQALGMWVPLVAHRPHVIHCHDFLALKSALGEVREQSLSWTGFQYQKLIRRGFSRGRNFISVSAHTQSDLHRFLPVPPHISEVVYNQVAPGFQPQKLAEARWYLTEVLEATHPLALSVREGYLLHVGANVWYKNKQGVLELYNAWREQTSKPLPLIMIGSLPGPELINWVQKKAWGKDVVFLEHVQEEFLVNAYSGATALLFPSLEEGFGWPVAEAMACGCPVVTTNKAPMTEVGGNAAFYLARRPADNDAAAGWAQEGAKIIHQLVNLSAEERSLVTQTGFLQVKKFNARKVLIEVDALYHHILHQHKATPERLAKLP